MVAPGFRKSSSQNLGLGMEELIEFVLLVLDLGGEIVGEHGGEERIAGMFFEGESETSGDGSGRRRRRILSVEQGEVYQGGGRAVESWRQRRHLLPSSLSVAVRAPSIGRVVRKEEGRGVKEAVLWVLRLHLVSVVEEDVRGVLSLDGHGG